MNHCLILNVSQIITNRLQQNDWCALFETYFTILYTNQLWYTFSIIIIKPKIIFRRTLFHIYKCGRFIKPMHNRCDNVFVYLSKNVDSYLSNTLCYDIFETFFPLSFWCITMWLGILWICMCVIPFLCAHFIPKIVIA